MNLYDEYQLKPMSKSEAFLILNEIGYHENEIELVTLINNIEYVFFDKLKIQKCINELKNTGLIENEIELKLTIKGFEYSNQPFTIT